MQFIEDHERSPRAWYGGAVGLVGFDGNLNTGLTLRTIRVQGRRRRGARGRDAALRLRSRRGGARDAAQGLGLPRRDPRRPARTAARRGRRTRRSPARGKRVLLVDHQDSFVHTLANYFRQTGAEVTTLRAGFPPSELDALAPDLVVLSPGPGTPGDFDCRGHARARSCGAGIPVFGVCLGLQGMVEHFGGALGVLDYPMHGKASRIRVVGGAPLRRACRSEFTAGRYHSLFAIRDRAARRALVVTAESDDGVVMASSTQRCRSPPCSSTRSRS